MPQSDSEKDSAPSREQGATPEEIFGKYDTGEEGLSADEAARRLDQYGPNALQEERTSALRKFLGYFWGPIPWMIEIAALLSAVVGHWADLVIILVLLAFNAGVGFYQEYNAGNAIDQLKKSLALKARVRRGGDWKQIDATELVPGDVVRLRLGDIVPADVALTEGEYLNIDQSALTGESLPVKKSVGESAFSGSVVKQGEMVGVVSATGAQTYFGKTARLVGEAHTTSHFQRAVLNIGDYLIYMTLGLVAILVLVELHRHHSLIDVAQFALILTVAAIPVAMPAVLSVTMAIGAVALSRMKAIVARLESIEEMAGMDILCSDKTGTLTENKLTLGDPEPYGKTQASDLIITAALASKEEDGDPIDLAVINGVEDKAGLSDYTVDDFKPFDPVVKHTEATVKGPDGKQFTAVKGAPQVVRDLCGEANEMTAWVDERVNDLAGRGFRTLGVARRMEGGDWQFLGLLPLYDPPREDAAETIKAATEHGVDVRMVTGDNVAIAQRDRRRAGASRRHPRCREDPRCGRRRPGHAPGNRAADRRGGRIRPGLPRTQVRHRQGVAGPRPLGGHDRRWRQRRAGAQSGRCGYRGLRRHRRGALRRRSGADRARPFGDRARRGGGAAHLRAYELLRHLPHHRDHPDHDLRGPGHAGLRLLPHHCDHDHPAGPVERSADHGHRLRQYLAGSQAGAMEHAPGADGVHRPWGLWAWWRPSLC